MKIYVKAERESRRLPYNYWYAGQKPTDYMNVDILGNTIGGQCVFYVQNPNNTWGYFWGEAPSTTLNLFGEFAMRVAPSFNEPSLGLDISNLSSDSEIINAVNERLLEFVSNDIANTFADMFSIDWTSCEWKVLCALCICITVPDVGSFYIYDTARSGNFVPQSDVFIRMIKNDFPIPDTVKKFNTYKEALNYIAYENKIKKVQETPYPEGITDDIADTIYEFHRFIYKEKLGNASNLEDAKHFIEDRTTRNTRSSRYGDERITDKIDILFDWAEDHNITPQKLVALSNKVYRMYLDKRRRI